MYAYYDQWFVKFLQQPYIQQNKEQAVFLLNYWLSDHKGI